MLMWVGGEKKFFLIVRFNFGRGGGGGNTTGEEYYSDGVKNRLNRKNFAQKWSLDEKIFENFDQKIAPPPNHFSCVTSGTRNTDRGKKFSPIKTH